MTRLSGELYSVWRRRLAEMTEWGLGVRYYLTLNQTLCIICLLVRPCDRDGDFSRRFLPTHRPHASGQHSAGLSTAFIPGRGPLAQRSAHGISSELSIPTVLST